MGAISAAQCPTFTNELFKNVIVISMYGCRNAEITGNTTKNTFVQSNSPIARKFFNYVTYQTNHEVMFNEPFGVSESMWYVRNEPVLVQ